MLIIILTKIFCIMKRIAVFLFFFFLLACCCNELEAQIRIDFKVSLYEKKARGIKLLINSSKLKEKTRFLNSSGKCSMKFKFNDFYTIKVIKDGFVSKIIELNTDVTQDVIKEGGDFPKKKIKLTLYPNKKDVDISLCSKAVIKFAYDRDMDDLMRDKKYEMAIAPDLKILEDKLKIKDIETRNLAVVQAPKKEKKKPIVKKKVIVKPSVKPIEKPVLKKKTIKATEPVVSSAKKVRKKKSSKNERIYPVYYSEAQIAMAYKNSKELITKARLAYKNANYPLARYYFDNALLLVRLEGENIKMYNSIDKKIEEIKNRGEEQEFLALKKKADEFYEKGSFTYSRYFYKLALKMKPNDKFVCKRLMMIRDSLDK